MLDVLPGDEAIRELFANRLECGLACICVTKLCSREDVGSPSLTPFAVEGSEVLSFQGPVGCSG